MFFKPFPKVSYQLTDEQTIKAVNIVSANVVTHWAIDKYYSYEKYSVIGNESLEAIAYKLYGRADYYWVLLVLNDIINPFTLWYGNDVVKYCSMKYGDPYAVRHYIDVRDNRICDDLFTKEIRSMDPSDVPEWIVGVTYLEYEELEVANKRELFYISKRHINKFIEDYRVAISKGS